MSRTAQAVLEQALHLPAPDRAHLLDALHKSFDRSLDPAIEAAWVREAEARLGAYTAGEVKAIPVGDILKRLEP